MDSPTPEKPTSQPSAEQDVIGLSITLTKDGVKVEGCIGDKRLAYGLLESARDAIFMHHLNEMVRETQGKIVRSNGAKLRDIFRR